MMFIIYFNNYLKILMAILLIRAEQSLHKSDLYLAEFNLCLFSSGQLR